MKLILKISIFTVLMFFSLGIVNAQVPGTSIDGVTVNINPENPSPDQDVKVSIESYNTDLTGASIVWSVAGKTYSNGIGLKSISVKAPKLGITLDIKVYIKTIEGREIQKNVIIRSGSIDFIWESKGYVPNFYKGKAPFVYQNSLHIIAIPHLSSDGIKEIDPSTLLYKWKMNGKNIEGASGYGKQSVNIISDEIPKQIQIEVEVSTMNQQRNAVGNLLLDPESPSVEFYEEDPLYGILFNKAIINKVQLKNNEMKILAVPFGFNIDSKNDYNSYTWSINNIEQSDLLKNRSITIRTKGDQDGSSDINLEIRNLKDILQGTRGSFSVYYNKKSNQNSDITF